MPSWAQRLITIGTGAGVVVIGALVPGAESLVAIGMAVCSWALPHPADKGAPK